MAQMTTWNGGIRSERRELMKEKRTHERGEKEEEKKQVFYMLHTKPIVI